MVTTTVKSGEARIKWRDLLDQILSGKGDVDEFIELIKAYSMG